MRRLLFRCGIAFLFLATAGRGALAQDLPRTGKSPSGRVLFIGIDGFRFDALQAAEAPNLKRLVKEGAYSDRTQILGKRYRRNNTVSGPGWSTLLTGVWADKHGVDDNRFTAPKYDRYPHFFARVKQAFPKASTISIATWKPIAERIVSDADFNGLPKTGELYVPGDEETANMATQVLRGGDPTAMFVYFGQVDEHGHKFGFSPEVPEYVAAIERVDGHVGRVLEALEKRAEYAEEKWLVIVSTDHGGFGKDHGGGHERPEILNGFMIVRGGSIKPGKLAEPTEIVDVVPTALTHLGIVTDAKWELDGRAVGVNGNRKMKNGN